MEPTVPLAIALSSAVLLLLGAILDDRRARVRRRAEVSVDPPLVHSINDDRCIGCEACVDVCPTEVLELVDHKVKVARFTDCVQCEQCANACPTTALVMFRQGGVPQTLTVPELDAHFQTGVPGQYLIGEVAGKPLVKNAANLGRAVIEHITRILPAGRPADLLDVVIVGSGPGGLSAGLACHVNRLSCVVLEKEHVLASTVSRYPKGKLFMAEPADSGNVSYLPVFDATKEELVAAWQQVVEGVKLPVKLGEAVESVKRGDDGTFTVKTTVATYRARTVVLATGLRGKPRLLAVPGANLEKVRSRLDDPDDFGGQHVLVVGGGDSAVEGAMSLADAGATVTLSYRGDGFKRCKQGNQKRLAEMTAANALTVLLESNVKEFTEGEVSIKLKTGETITIPNQHAFVLIGADTPVAWLEAAGVRFVEREHLYALGSTEDTVRSIVPDATECPANAADALARLIGKPVKKPSHGRLTSIVEHIHDEWSDFVTSVTGVFKSPFEDGESYRTKTRTSPRHVRARTPAPLPKKKSRTEPVRIIPVAKLTRRTPPTGTSNPFEPEPTVSMPAYGQGANPRAKPPSHAPRTSTHVVARPTPAPRPTPRPAPAPVPASPFRQDPDTDVEHTSVDNSTYHERRDAAPPRTLASGDGTLTAVETRRPRRAGTVREPMSEGTRTAPFRFARGTTGPNRERS